MSEKPDSTSYAEVDSLLRKLPPAAASVDFTQRVLSAQRSLSTQQTPNTQENLNGGSSSTPLRPVYRRLWLGRGPWPSTPWISTPWIRAPWIGAVALASGVVLGALFGPLVVSWLQRDSSAMLAARELPPRSLQAAALGSEASDGDVNQVAALREQYNALQDELVELQRLVSEAQPVVGLGGNDRVDYVVDLREFLGRAPIESASSGADVRALPVSNQ